jgi:hypothetical protein
MVTIYFNEFKSLKLTTKLPEIIKSINSDSNLLLAGVNF